MSGNDNGIPDPESDTHAHVRFFKLLEVAYNCARNGHYESAAQVAKCAYSYYQNVDVEGSVERRKNDE